MGYDPLTEAEMDRALVLLGNRDPAKMGWIALARLQSKARRQVRREASWEAYRAKQGR